MLIKEADDSQRALEVLEALLARPGLRQDQRQRIEDEIRFIDAGLRAERDQAAYQINFHLEDSANWAVIHDLRLELGDRVAQIDHFLVNRRLDVWVCETKSFAGGVEINERGEWVRLWDGNRTGIPSPIEQNHRHVALLHDVFKSGAIRLPKRLGVTLQPAIDSLVLISTKGEIRRPKGVRVDGLDSVIKVDQLMTTINRRVDKETAARTLQAGVRLVSRKTLEEFAWALAGLHRPSEVDWAAKFGLGEVEADQPPRVPVVRCALCERTVTAGEVDYCQDQRERFSGRILCYACQHK